VATIALCTPAALLALLCVIAQAPGRLVIAAIIFPKVFQYTRNLLSRSAALPHVLAARARGLNGSRLFLRHILPVAAPQLFAVAGVTVSTAFAAAIPVEALCDMPGIGQLAWKAALARDLELLVMLTMIVTTVTLLANSSAELLGKAVAPRVTS
jgi:peptide/nickel transport system permease protein